jgi:hypothetical protein
MSVVGLDYSQLLYQKNLLSFDFFTTLTIHLIQKCMQVSSTFLTTHFTIACILNLTYLFICLQ